LFNYKKVEIVSLAKNNGFRSETLEKVLRLIDVLYFINTNDELFPYLVLKGGTSINFTIFNLPRLSVDIDLDFSFNGTRSEMLRKRKEITAIIRRYMEINNYTFNATSKNKYALYSFVFNYLNSFGNKDNLKIEINYMNRTHIFEPVIRNVSITNLSPFKILTLNKYELFGSKIKALLERCTIRDVYDVYHMLISRLFSNKEYEIVKKCTIFYIAIGKASDKPIDKIVNDFYLKIDTFITERMPQYLSSTLRNNDKFNMSYAVNMVKDFIKKLILLTDDEIRFLNDFDNGIYNPSLLFNDSKIIDRVINHPMALWKKSNKKIKRFS